MRGLEISRVDFVRRPGTPLAGWLLLVLGLAACGGLAVWHGHQLREAAEREAVRHAQELAEVRGREQAQRRAAPTPETLRRAKAQRWLQWPWIEALRTIESGTESPVYLLSLAGDMGQPEFRLEAEAADFAQALVYVRRLTESGGFAEARLQAHEQVPDPMTGGHKVRFTVVATWSPR